MMCPKKNCKTPWPDYDNDTGRKLVLYSKDTVMKQLPHSVDTGMKTITVHVFTNLLQTTNITGLGYSAITII